MNERVPVEFSVSQIGFRRAAETFTARVEIVWGVQALPYVMEEEIVGTESAEYLAAAEELTEEQLLQQYPPTVVWPGFAFTGSAACQITPVIYTTEIYSGYVLIRPATGSMYETVDGQWSLVEADTWEQSLPGTFTDESSNTSGTIRYKSYPLFIGDPTDTCGTDDPTTPTDPTEPEPPTVIPDGGGGNMGTVVSPAPSAPNASLPGCVTLTEYTCPVSDPNEELACVQACQNPFYAMDNPTTCDAPTVTSIRIEPSTVRAGVGRRGVYRVVAVFSDGRLGDVTGEATPVIADGAKASLLSNGIIGGLVAGATTLTAAWKGKTATATLQVFTSTCATDQTWDVVFVLDQAVASYWFASRPSAPGCGMYWRRTAGRSDYVAEYGTAALALMLGMSLKNPWDSDAGTDRISVVVTGDGSPRVAVTWTDTVPSVTALCQATTDSRIGESLRAARTMLNSARAGATKLVVLLTCGSESVCSPSARTAAGELDDAGILVAVVTPLHSGMPWTVYSPCTYPETALDYLESLAAPAGLVFEDPAGIDALGMLAGIQAAYCAL